MSTMTAIILAAILSSRGIPATATEGLVIVQGRPGCTALALHNDVTSPVLLCTVVSK